MEYPSKRYICYVDGGCPENGRSAQNMFGSYVVYDATDMDLKTINHESTTYLPPVIEKLRFNIKPTFNVQRITNNTAEALSMYYLFSDILTEKILKPDTEIVIYSDSQIVLRQVQGIYNVTKSHLRTIYEWIYQALAKFAKRYDYNLAENIVFTWIPGDTMKKTRIAH